MWVAINRIMVERKRKELDPVLRQIERLRQIKDADANPDELLAFNSALKNVHDIGNTTDKFFTTISRTKKVKLFKWFNKLKK